MVGPSEIRIAYSDFWDDFDPNDESTWPPGIDTFEELLEWLINNPNPT